MSRPVAVWVFLVGVAIASSASALRVQSLLPVDRSLISGDLFETLSVRRAELAGWRRQLKADLQAFNKRCAQVRRGSAADRQCLSDKNDLRHEMQVYGRAVQAFNGRVTGELLRIRRDFRFPGGGVPVSLLRKHPGNPFRVNLQKLAGFALVGEDAAAFVAGKNWPAEAKGTVLAALMLIEGERYGQAVWLLENARRYASGDPWLEAAVTRVKGRLAGRVRWATRAETDVAALMAVAAQRWVIGDTATAVRMAERAAGVRPGDPDLQRFLVRARKLHTLRRDLPTPAQRKARMERAATWAQGQAALKLGVVLAAQSAAKGSKDHRKWALFYLDDASRRLSGRGRRVIDGLRNKLRRNERLKPQGVPHESRKAFYDSKAGAMLDALEYGKGDWERSLQYLDHVQQAFPFDPAIARARRELRSVRKQADRS